MTATRRTIVQRSCAGCGREVTFPLPESWHISKRGLPWCPDCPRHPGPRFSQEDGPRCGRAVWADGGRGRPCRVRVKEVGWPCYGHRPWTLDEWVGENPGRVVALEEALAQLRTDLAELDRLGELPDVEDFSLDVQLAAVNARITRIAREFAYGDEHLARRLYYGWRWRRTEDL